MNLLTQLPVGRYIVADSFLHQLDPRTKLLVILAFIFTIFQANNIMSFAVATLFVFYAIKLSPVSSTYLIKGFKLVWMILVLTSFFHIFFTRQGELIFSLGFIEIYREGLERAGIVSLRLALLILLASLLTLTTKPLALALGIERLLHPLKKLKVPVHEFALMLTVALRFVPTLTQELERLIKAQRARGATFTKGRTKDRMAAVIPIFIPLLVSSFQRAEDLAVAMEARGYTGGEGRTQLRQLHFSADDAIAGVVTVGVCLLLLTVRSWSL
ncbi:energy-coupling factor transporter transmembrane component T family protein [Caldalkalibacillus salinus]|uniref:energy-coupling factor transporter transmembrane component T family protein n=1 Tax=Caldalkalibacillus salinus TaxID=2803787 RepID=UPI0019236746|nr:energy-coupling factor transporter transmembrane component T [Caldalkalibacillus salinus]